MTLWPAVWRDPCRRRPSDVVTALQQKTQLAFASPPRRRLRATIAASWAERSITFALLLLDAERGARIASPHSHMDLAVILPLAALLIVQGLLSLALLAPRGLSKHAAALLAKTRVQPAQSVVYTIAAAVFAMTLSSCVQLRSNASSSSDTFGDSRCVCASGRGWVCVGGGFLFARAHPSHTHPTLPPPKKPNPPKKNPTTHTRTQVGASLIIVYTHSGRTAQLVAKYRPLVPVLT